MKASGGSFVRNAALAVGLSLALASIVYSLRAATAAAPIPTGTVMVATGNGLYTEYTQTGTLVTQLDTTSGAPAEAGCAFDPLLGNFLTTNFSTSNVSEFDPTGVFIKFFGSGYNAHPEPNRYIFAHHRFERH